MLSIRVALVSVIRVDNITVGTRLLEHKVSKYSIKIGCSYISLIS